MKGLLQRKPRLNLEGDFPPYCESRVFLRQLFTLFQWDNLKHLRLAVHPELTQEEWLSWFGRLKWLDTIYVDGVKGAGLLSALSAPSTLEEPPQNMTLCFPTLRHLSLENWNFDDRNVHGRSPFVSLKVCLDKRRRFQVPLQSLSLYNCRFFTVQEVKHLSKFVHRVDWDGLESFTDSEDDHTSTSDEYTCSDSEDDDY